MFSRLFRHPSLGHKSWAPAYTGFLREAPYHLKWMQCGNEVLLSKNPTMLIPTEETVAEKEMIRHELLGLTVRSAFRGCHGVRFDVKGFRVSDLCLKLLLALVNICFLKHRRFGAFTSRLLRLRILDLTALESTICMGSNLSTPDSDVYRKLALGLICHHSTPNTKICASLKASSLPGHAAIAENHYGRSRGRVPRVEGGPRTSPNDH